MATIKDAASGFLRNRRVAVTGVSRQPRDLNSIPGGVDAVVIGTRPETADQTMRECAELGIEHVWMHRGPAPAASPEPRPSTAVHMESA